MGITVLRKKGDLLGFVKIDDSRVAPVGVGVLETIILPVTPEEILEVFNMSFRVAGPIGATAGTHGVSMTSNPDLYLFDVQYQFTDEIKWNYGHWGPTPNPAYAPMGFEMSRIAKRVFISADNPLTIYYINNTDAISTGTRYIFIDAMRLTE